MFVHNWMFREFRFKNKTKGFKNWQQRDSKKKKGDVHDWLGYSIEVIIQVQ